MYPAYPWKSKLTSFRTGFLVFIVALTSWSFPAWAQSSEEDRELFQAHLLNGGELLEAGEFSAAISELDRARQIIDHPRISLTIAGAYRDWGRCEKSRDEYDAVDARQDLTDDMRERLTRGLARLEQCVEMGSLSIDCNPPHATLRIDGEEVGCPFVGELPVGEHNVEITAVGHDDHVSTVQISSEQPTKEQIVLQPAEEKEEKEEELKVPVVAEVDDGRSTLDLVAYGAMGLDTGLLGAALFSDYRTKSRTDEIVQASEQGDTARLEQLHDEARSAQVRTTLFYVAGGALMATGLVLHVFDFSSSDVDDTTASMSLQIAPARIVTTLRW